MESKHWLGVKIKGKSHTAEKKASRHHDWLKRQILKNNLRIFGEFSMKGQTADLFKFYGFEVSGVIT